MLILIPTKKCVCVRRTQDLHRKTGKYSWFDALYSSTLPRYESFSGMAFMSAREVREADISLLYGIFRV
jgi:hypothetical protein